MAKWRCAQPILVGPSTPASGVHAEHHGGPHHLRHQGEERHPRQSDIMLALVTF